MIPLRYLSVLFSVMAAAATLSPIPTVLANHSATPSKWPVPYVDVDISDPSFPSSWISPLSSSMTTWNNAGSRFRFRSGNTGHKVYRAYFGPGHVARTYVTQTGGTTLQDTDMALNTYYLWSTSGSSCCRDVQNVITHEFGHWLFLYDLYAGSDAELTMYAAIPNGETKKRSLHQDDINSIRAMYP